MKLVLESIDVGCQSSVPYVICWRSGTYNVETVIDSWSTRGPWWTSDEQREYLLVSTSCGVMEIYHSTIQGCMISRLYD
jgi:hypothetical protein